MFLCSVSAVSRPKGLILKEAHHAILHQQNWYYQSISYLMNMSMIKIFFRKEMSWEDYWQKLQSSHSYLLGKIAVDRI